MTESTSLEDLVEPLRSAHPTVGELTLVLGECRIRVESNSEELLGVLRPAFRHVAAAGRGSADLVVRALECPEPDLGLSFRDWPRDPGKVGRKDTIADVRGGRVCRKARTGMQFLFGGDTRLAVGPCLANDNQVINFVNAQYIGWLLDRGWQLCHAAGVVWRGRGLALAGLSGGGKSTLALHLLSHGLSYTSNDRLLIKRTGRGLTMAGIPKLPRINPGTALNNRDLEPVLPAERRAALADMDQAELWRLEEKYDVDVGSLFGETRFEMVAPLRAFVVLAWSRDAGAPARLRPVRLAERPDLLRALMKPPGPFYLPADGAPPPAPLAVEPRRYLAELNGLSVYEATGGVDFGAAVEGCMELLDAGG